MIERFVAMLLLAGVMSLLASAQEPEVFTLEKSIEFALIHSKAIKTAEENVRLAEAKLMEARSGLLPKLSTTASYTYTGKLPEMVLNIPGLGMPTTAAPSTAAQEDIQDGNAVNPNAVALGGGGPLTVPMGSKKNFQTGLSAQQVLFAGGAIWNSVKQAELNLEAARLQLEAAKQDLTYKVKEAFYGVLLTRELVGVSKRALDQVEKHYKTAQDLVEVGTATKFELLRAQVQRANMKSQLIRAENAAQLAEEGLKLVIGYEGSNNLKFVGELKEREFDPDLNELIESALVHRPDYKATLVQVKSTEKLVKMAKGSYLPSLALVGTYGYSDTDEQEGQTTWNVMVTANWDIFSGFGRHAKVKQAESAVEQVKLGAAQLEDAIKLEVRSAYLSFKEAKSLLEAQEETVAQAKEGLRMANTQYENGLITSVELTDAELALMQAELSYFQALHDYSVAIAKIEKSTGEVEK